MARLNIEVDQTVRDELLTMAKNFATSPDVIANQALSMWLGIWYDDVPQQPDHSAP
ncbi:MAG: hypothetical protein Q8K79_04435 [Solirubrobacteraceae bacterium]|nr:hypothetical protein [Solirubrobacteraceae bacterium]